MTPKEALDQIRALFAAPDAPAAPMPEEQKPAEMEAKEYVLEGGAKVLISDLEVGGMVAVMNEDGTSSPAPAGDHKLADGTMITTNESGIITAVAMPPGAPVMPEEEMSKFRDELAALRSENAELRDRLASMGATFDKHYADTTDRMVRLAGILEGLLSVPAAEPVQAPKDKFEAQGPSQKEKLATLLATIDNMKKSK